jgi:hypothetical protein
MMRVRWMRADNVAANPIPQIGAVFIHSLKLHAIFEKKTWKFFILIIT